jgi:AmiR/NasT family two-component response regulator
MCQPSIDVIVTAQRILMNEHAVTSETALGLLVWAATDHGVTVLEVARTICDNASPQVDEPLLYATA